MKALRKIGVSVEHTHMVGGGFPDLLACHRGETMLIECKERGKSLNKQQAEFIARWPGKVLVVHSPKEAIEAVLGKGWL